MASDTCHAATIRPQVAPNTSSGNNQGRGSRSLSAGGPASAPLKPSGACLGMTKVKGPRFLSVLRRAPFSARQTSPPALCHIPASPAPAQPGDVGLSAGKNLPSIKETPADPKSCLRSSTFRSALAAPLLALRKVASSVH